MREPSIESIPGLHPDGSAATLQVVPLPGMRAWKLLIRLTKLIGPSLGAAAEGGLSGLEAMEKDVDFSQAIAALCDRLSEKDGEEIVRDLLSTCSVNDQALMPQFDVLFMGNMPALFAVLKAALKANYGNFSSALAGALKSLPRPAKALSSKG